MTLQGAGAGATIIDATGMNDRVFHVLTGAAASLSDLTIRGGIIPTTGIQLGGGLLNFGTLTLTRVVIRDNIIVGPPGGNHDGAAIGNEFSGRVALIDSLVTANKAVVGAISNVGEMTISNSQVMANTTVSAGGIENAGMMTIYNSQVLSNTSNGFGGGLANYSRLTISNTIISGNQANTPFGTGGGILNDGQLSLNNSLISANKADYGAGLAQPALNSGSVTISGSTIRDNQATTKGGGLSVDQGVITLTASTVLSNSAGLDGGGVYISNTATLIAVNSTLVLNSAKRNGGGVYQSDGSFAAYNVTLANNFANADGLGSGRGGGLYRASGPVILSNTVVADNLFVDSQGFANDDDCFGIFGMFRYSLVGVPDGCTFNNVNTLVGANPQLLPLAPNGGPTLTQALGPGSAALDAGDPAGCASPAGGLLLTDQRGLLRHADGNRDGQTRCDIGAYEVQLETFLPLLRR